MRRIAAFAMSILLPLCAEADTVETEKVVMGISRDTISITTNFDGSDILIFGAVKRETPVPDGAPLEVIITVEGPKEPVNVRRKEKRFGIWINTDSVQVDEAPSFYAVASSGPIADVLSATDNLRYKITTQKAIRSVGAPMNVLDSQSFSDALIRIRTENGLFLERENTVDVREQTLFRTSIAMPANLTEGEYRTRIFLTRDGQVVSDYETTIDVRMVGVERWLFTLSRNNPLAYAILSLVIAIAAGWSASAAFAALRRN